MFLILPVNISLAQQEQVNISTSWDQLPATNTHFNDDTNKFQFAVISDLWGGYRYGVFEDAVDKLDQLQPQFVISVGDLIDGATYDSLITDKQWTEFNEVVKSLSMPFFYVPGNHDIANEWMDKGWKRRFGLTYYHFIFKNVLFLCLNTQDGGAPCLTTEQMTYFKKVIEDNPDVRWTFIFMHRPVWLGETGEEEGYEEIETALKGKNYTVFSGHQHTYLGVTKNGNKHFVLGSTGGGSDLRGEEFGEFDHITWVTVNSLEPPKIINLKLDCLVKEKVSNENPFPSQKNKIRTYTPR